MLRVEKDEEEEGEGFFFNLLKYYFVSLSFIVTKKITDQPFFHIHLIYYICVDISLFVCVCVYIYV